MHPQLTGLIWYALMNMFAVDDPGTNLTNINDSVVLLNASANALNLLTIVNASKNVETTTSLPKDESVPFQIEGSYSPLSNSKNYFERVLIGNVSVGTPAVPFRFLFDTIYYNETMLFGEIPAILSSRGIQTFNFSSSNTSASTITDNSVTFRTQKKIETIGGKQEHVTDYFWTAEGSRIERTFVLHTPKSLKGQSILDNITNIFSTVNADGVLNLRSPLFSPSSFIFLEKSPKPIVTYWTDSLSFEENDTAQRAVPSVVLRFGDNAAAYCNASGWFSVPQLTTNNGADWTFRLQSIAFTSTLYPLVMNSQKDSVLEKGFANAGSSNNSATEQQYRTRVENGQKSNGLLFPKNSQPGTKANTVAKQAENRKVEQKAAVVITQTLSSGPLAHVEFIANELRAQKGRTKLGDNLFSVPCNEADHNLVLNLHLENGQLIRLNSSDYFIKADAEPGNCILIFVEANKQIREYEWTFGATVFTKHCVQLNYKQRMINFSPVLERKVGKLYGK
jgi:hypothetical protein